MNVGEANIQRDRLNRYDALVRQRDHYQTLIAKVEAGDESGPCKQGPFTSNTRESRDIASMKLEFTETRGGAHAVDMFLPADNWGLGIRAPELARFLVGKWRERIEEINKAILAI